MIKKFKIEQTDLSNTTNIMTSKGWNGFIVTDKRIYYQGKGGKPVIIGNSDNWVTLSSNADIMETLAVGRKYIRATNLASSFNLPGNEYAQAVGDTIEFYNRAESKFIIKSMNTNFISDTTATSGQYFKFVWTGTVWQTLDGGGTAAAQQADKIITSLNKHYNFDG
jgi:hypothetical protein